MDEQPALIKRIQRLVVDCTPYIRDVRTVEEVQNAYLHMEEMNKDFHKYHFVKYLRSEIEKELRPVIEAEIERCAERTYPVTKRETPDVASITNKVLNSPQYHELSERMRNNVSAACDSILANFEESFMCGSGMIWPDYLAAKETGRHNRHGGTEPLFSDAESSTLGDNSLNQSTVIFMNAADQQRVAYNLDKQKNIETRRAAINELLHVTSFDIQNCSVWPAIRTGLVDGLADEHEDLCMPCLHFVARGLNTNSISSREMYVVLVEFLESQFSSQQHTYQIVKDGLDIHQSHVKKLLKSFRLLNFFQQLLPQYWQRHLEGCLENSLKPTMSLLAKHAECIHLAAGGLTPLHFLALVDCEAKWFINTMHGHSSRSKLLEILEDAENRQFVNNAVLVCMKFMSSVSSAEHVDHYSGAPNRSRMFYRAHEVKFAHFLHCLCIISRLIIYEHGRRFFPVQHNGKAVNLTDLLESLLLFVAHDSGSHHHRCTLADKFNPCLLIMDMMKKLCASEDICHNTLCKDRLILVLMTPISAWLENLKGIGHTDKVSDVVLAHVAEVLSAIASTRCGQRMLLYGENCVWQSSVNQSSTSTPVHVLAEFAKIALKDDMLPKRVVGSLVFVCRQLYSTCEGLLQLSHHKLHNSLTSAWKLASRDGDCATPTPSVELSTGEMHHTYIWEDMLQDDLLNFAATPKGVLLLEQTGAMCECVSYMYSRYARKLQVSSCEKFGYGYMMSQIAATAPGIAAMDRTGFTCALIQALWSAVETLDDGTLSVPKFWPASPVEKVAKKPFTNIVNLLSSFRSIFEVIGSQPLPPPKQEYSHRQGPTTVIDLLDRLTFIDSSAKIQSLFNYEDSHVFGLRLLSVLTSCLDTALLLQDKYKFQDMLLQSQGDNIDSKNVIIVDMLSLERNYILVKTYLVGGPSERSLPPRTLQIGDCGFVYQLFSSYPVPAKYIVDRAQKPSRDDSAEIAKFFSSLDLKQSWLDKTSKLLVLELAERNDDLSLNVCMQLIEHAVEVRRQTPTEAVFPNISSPEPYSTGGRTETSALQHLGATVTVRYGCYLKLLSREKEDHEQLCQLLKKCSLGLKLQQCSPNKSDLKCVCNDRELGFDWFAATVFLMASGNADRTYKFLSNFSSLLGSAFLWTQRMHCLKLLPRSFVSSGIPPLYAITCHNVELILQLELPHIYSVFRMSGCSPAQICQQWLNQCFWNYLDWAQIYQYMTVCIVLGADYQVYVCIAILRHLQHELMQQMQDKNLLIFLKEEAIHHFNIREHLHYMQQLQKKYGQTVLSDMRGIFREP